MSLFNILPVIRSSWEENESRKEFLEIRNLHCENISSFGGGGGREKESNEFLISFEEKILVRNESLEGILLSARIDKTRHDLESSVVSEIS